MESRLGQGKFRKELIELWNGRCPVTNVSNSVVLRASHIKPWRDSKNDERLDRFNGILLSAHIDALFDKFYISFDKDSGKLLKSIHVSNEDLSALGLDENISIEVFEEMKPYLEYHNNLLGV